MIIINSFVNSFDSHYGFFLSGLCYKSEMVSQLWQVLLSLGPSCGLKSFLDLLSVSTKATAPEFHMLMLFCDATAHLVT